jgi:hypothetical protein
LGITVSPHILTYFLPEVGGALKKKKKKAHIDLDEKTIFHQQTWSVIPMVDLLGTF